MGVQYSIDRGKYYNAVVLTPQCPTNGWWSNYEIDRLVSHAIANYKVNPKRVLVTGLSMGGGGTWDYVTGYPSRVAAVMPICGASGCAAATGNLAAQKVKVWGFHAIDDGVVGVGNSYSCMNKIGEAIGQVATFESAYSSSIAAEQTGHFNPSTMRWVFESEVDCQDSQGRPWPIPVCQTLYRTGGHNIWYNVYQHPTDAPMLWLLQQVRP